MIDVSMVICSWVGVASMAYTLGVHAAAAASRVRALMNIDGFVFRFVRGLLLVYAHG